MLSVVMLNVCMLCVIMLNVIMLCRGITTFSSDIKHNNKIAAPSIMTPSTTSSVNLSVIYTECCAFYIAMLSVILLNVVVRQCCGALSKVRLLK
jgi:hypothetical protein